LGTDQLEAKQATGNENVPTATFIVLLSTHFILEAQFRYLVMYIDVLYHATHAATYLIEIGKQCAIRKFPDQVRREMLA
jgi:hypothetical protein